MTLKAAISNWQSARAEPYPDCALRDGLRSHAESGAKKSFRSPKAGEHPAKREQRHDKSDSFLIAFISYPARRSASAAGKRHLFRALLRCCGMRAGLHPITPKTGVMGAPSLRRKEVKAFFRYPAFSKSAVRNARRACTDWASLFRAAGTGVT